MGFHDSRNSCSRHILLIFSCFIGLTASIDTISGNQSVHDPDYLISSGGNFKLGFFSPANNSKRYVGVMHNLPVLTVIWVANRDNPLNDSTGSLSISTDGNLVILNGRNDVVWSTNIQNSTANSSALLLDTGDLVLRAGSNNDTYIWESFRHASDSLVENMRVFTDLSTNEKNALTSWRSDTDPAPGIYTGTLEVVRIPEFFVMKNGVPYWRSGPWNNQKFIGISDMISFYKTGFELESTSSTSAYLYFSYPNISVYYVLEPLGDLLEKVWSDEAEDWVVTWSSIGSECDVYGKCGPYGSCNSKDKPMCRCIQGFVPTREDEWGAGNWSSGCRRRTELQCGGNSSDGFVKMSGVKPPDRFEWYVGDCREECLKNCSCVAYAFTEGIGCMQWGEGLIDVQEFPDGGGVDLYVRLPHSELGKKKHKKGIIAVPLVLGFIAFALCTFFLRKLFLKYRARRKPQNEEIQLTNEGTDTGYSEETTLQNTVYGVKLDELFLYKFQMLSNATQDFSLINKLGEGGFGPVYKGKLGNRQEIAVKRLARSSNQGLEEFMNEVEVISRLQHRNLVKLLGCCVESEEKMLVYEYMPNGSLDTYLFDSRKRKDLDWKKRMNIIEGICRGLLYLHRDSRLRIIHRDLKASNILLDEELHPKISDFGMARIFGCKDDEVNTIRVVGTYGYMSPEYALHGIFSEKSDVYSFGVLLLETVSGRRNARFCDEDRQLFLIAYAWKLWNDGNIINLMDPSIYDPKMEGDIERYANIGLLCVQENAAERPNITTVLLMLSCEIVQLPPPKQPAFVGIPRYDPETEYSLKNSSTQYSVNNVTVSVVEGR